MIINQIVSLLADGEFHSGEELGEALGGVSRTAVWKHLKKLEDLGIVLESRKGLGYRVEGGFDLLDSKAISAALPDSIAQRVTELDVQLLTDSTNAQALQAGRACGYVCSAEQQSAGRGRRGRQWISPFARNLYLSVRWHFTGGAVAASGLSLAIGVAVVAALHKLGFVELQLKWPNDIYCRGRKLAGVLLEMQGDASGECDIVVGVGCNVNMPVQAGQAIDQPWIDLRELCGSEQSMPPRSIIAAAFIAEIVSVLADFEQCGFAAYRNEWQRLNCMADQAVVLLLGERQVTGTMRGVDMSGALLLDDGSGVQAYAGGEISVRSEKTA